MIQSNVDNHKKHGKYFYRLRRKKILESSYTAQSVYFNNVKKIKFFKNYFFYY